MYGAMIGDIVGSAYEFDPVKVKHFILFPRECDITDDSIMTVAVARALMQWHREGGDLHEHMIRHMRLLGGKYRWPTGGYGSMFGMWLRSRNPEPYDSWGNGSAMRVSPCGLMARTLEEALELAKVSAEVTHNHPEGIKGAQATAAAVFLAKIGCDKQEIRDYIDAYFYPLNRTLEQIRPKYYFDGSCQGTVPASILAFLESESYEDAIRNTVSLGGDADTMGAITGAIAWTYYRTQNGGELTRDMQAMLDRAKQYIYPEFIQTAEEFEALCAELTE